MMRMVGVLCAVLACSGCGWAQSVQSVYVSPTGSDANSGRSPQAPVLTLNRARDISRQLRASYPTSGINVVLAPGTYDLSSNALELQAAALDGGASPAAPIHYFAAAPNTVTLSGGRTLSGWRPSQRFPGAPANSSLSTCPTSAQPADNCGYPYSAEYDCVERGCCWAPGGVQPSGSWCNYRTAHTRYAAWELPVQASQVRHLIVNGRAALRPRITDPVQLYGMNPNGFFSNSSEVAGGTYAVYLKQPCWQNLLNKPCGQVPHGPPQFIENVITASSDWQLVPGSFFMDEAAGMLYYVPRADDDMTTAEVILPVAEDLIIGAGTASQKLAHVRFTNLTFAYTTWLRPSQADGYVEMQSGSCTIGSNPNNYDCGHEYLWIKSPGTVRFATVEDITFSQCQFHHIGGVALDFGGGAHNCTVERSYFHHVSGAAVQIGSFDTFNVTDFNLQDAYNTVIDTVVERAAAEFHGAVAINVGYTIGTTITHCEVYNLTYSGMNIGWGWSRRPSYAAANNVSFCRVHDYKQNMNDGGGIYMLGPMLGTVIHDNWVYNQGTPSSGALYPDEGSAYETWYNNVVTNIGSSEWLHLWTASIHNITVRNNYADTSTYENHGTNCPMVDNTIFKPGNPPAAATAIMQASGVRSNPYIPPTQGSQVVTKY